MRYWQSDNRTPAAVLPLLRTAQEGNLARPHPRSSQGLRKPGGLTTYCHLPSRRLELPSVEQDDLKPEPSALEAHVLPAIPYRLFILYDHSCDGVIRPIVPNTRPTANPNPVKGEVVNMRLQVCRSQFNACLCPGRDCCDFNTVWTHFPRITQLCGLCCLEETTQTLVYCDVLLRITRLCGLCCLEETTPTLVYCDVLLRITRLCGLCCLEETTPTLVYCDVLLRITRLCGLCCLEETTPTIVYCDVFLLNTRLCGLCCLEETTATLVYCHVFLRITEAAMQCYSCDHHYYFYYYF